MVQDKLFLTKYNANGTYGWTRILGGGTSGTTIGFGVATDSLNNPFFSGQFARGATGPEIILLILTILQALIIIPPILEQYTMHFLLNITMMEAMPGGRTLGVIHFYSFEPLQEI